ncbi:CbrC family protein [Streptomyces sp. NBC_00401]|uniref:CbrC family protein n=2 Tax=Streptomyces TaxID=1883 RepID=UPI002B1DD9E3|nr:CbrC family protein [Streptomyces sp. NBC_00401]
MTRFAFCRAMRWTVRSYGLLRSRAVTEWLPEFPYHPDPVATGVVVPSEKTCVRCEQARGYIYTGPVYAVEEIKGLLCPWCVADGSAAERFDAHFTDGTWLGEDVPLEVFAAVDQRSPGFAAWQETQWFFHCGDGAAFLGRAGAGELAVHPEALEMLRREASGWGRPADQVEHYVGSLDKDGQATAYLFRCRVCAIHLAYSDFT